MTDWAHTANAATVREHEVFTNMSAWLIVKKIGWAGSSLSNGRMTDWAHTANAATVREHEVFTNMSAWLIVKKIECPGSERPKDG